MLECDIQWQIFLVKLERRLLKHTDSGMGNNPLKPKKVAISFVCLLVTSFWNVYYELLHCN